MRHRDPERREVVGGPVAVFHAHRREVVIVERAALDLQRVGELDASVRVLDLDGHGASV